MRASCCVCASNRLSKASRVLEMARDRLGHRLFDGFIELSLKGVLALAGGF
jgi:hypothetical protein